MKLHTRIREVTERIALRSRATRAFYLAAVSTAAAEGTRRGNLGCANQAHGFAACGPGDKATLRQGKAANLGIITAYNDMLSAHQPYERFPDLIRAAAREAGGVAQVAGGVPAMCDGITQGEKGMELSLFSRDVIALSTVVALSHQTFDGAIFLGICDKIVPGLVMGALAFGHLPAMFIPSGPMTSGYSNDDRKLLRQQYAEGRVSREELLDAESKSYHEPGTCTFYGTANTNQMMMEIMGLHLPGSSFVNPNTPLRDALTREATRRALEITSLGSNYTPVGVMLDERAFVNGLVGLLATGGSTNHTMHMVAMAAAAGIRLEWNDFADLAEIIPTLVRVYPNGKADVNHFHAAGGMGFVMRELLHAGLLHGDVRTVWGTGLEDYTKEPMLNADGEIVWRPGALVSGDETLLRGVSNPFETHGGLRVADGNLGRSIVKTSAIALDRYVIEAPALVFHSQDEMLGAFLAGELYRDAVVIVRFQGPKANGMPELHKLLPPLQAVQKHGYKVALVTDGRLSGASGDVLSAIHVTPEAAAGGAIGKICDGDIIRIDATTGELNALVEASEWDARSQAIADLSESHYGVGRELFASFRREVSTADHGASIFAGAGTTVPEYAETPMVTTNV
ncbi:phosphogluconate dehydratase [Granulicella arctica]|uniref:Phosphogluconate dehydratase n=1 Tax=Granulicella arctica TaxID=940613 RepID=A0A7Y9PDU4_9BACT|nr:phosphogluconate dehydratase [Granulicella arctica]NYF78098.1 phosphogluconate dehydratase [Granulicella arctica]